MSVNDRKTSPMANGRPSPLFERRVDPGVNTLNPQRVDPPSKLAVKIPRGPDLTGMPARLPVKAPKGPAGVKITIKPLSKAGVAKAMASPSAKAGDAFRKTLPGKSR